MDFVQTGILFLIRFFTIKGEITCLTLNIFTGKLNFYNFTKMFLWLKLEPLVKNGRLTNSPFPFGPSIYALDFNLIR